jgi:hypothetical protein
MEVYIASKKGLKISLALLETYVTNEPDPLHAKKEIKCDQGKI